MGTIVLLTPTQCIKDRLAAFYHWNDPQSLEQAIAVYKSQHAKVNLQELNRWSRKESESEKFSRFKKRITA